MQYMNNTTALKKKTQSFLRYLPSLTREDDSQRTKLSVKRERERERERERGERASGSFVKRVSRKTASERAKERERQLTSSKSKWAKQT